MDGYTVLFGMWRLVTASHWTRELNCTAAKI